MLVRLIYASRSAGMLKADTLNAIIATAQDFNSAHDVTGVLCYGNDRFLQYIEGERDVINRLYARILLDGRHRDPVLLSYRAIEERLFYEWSMGFVRIMDDNVMRILREVTRSFEFQPETWTAQQSITAIRRLRPYIAASVMSQDETERLLLES